MLDIDLKQVISDDDEDEVEDEHDEELDAREETPDLRQVECIPRLAPIIFIIPYII